MEVEAGPVVAVDEAAELVDDAVDEDVAEEVELANGTWSAEAPKKASLLIQELVLIL